MITNKHVSLLTLAMTNTSIIDFSFY